MTSFKIKNVSIPHRLILAPMCGITLKPFRQICKENGAGLVFNQMVAAKAITMGDAKSFKILSFDPKQESPVGVQLFGNDADTLAEAATILESHGPDVIDLNLGCPARKIVSGGGGSALMSDEKKLHVIFKKMRKAIQGAFTIKVRAGWDEKSKNALNIAKMAENEGVDAVAIHARTRAQGYSGKADWSFIKHVKENVKIPVIGNGDITSAAEAHRMLEETGCDAVMTGRGAMQQPWIFRNFVEKCEKTPDDSVLQSMIFKQYELFMEFFGENTGIKMMRKFLCAYSRGKKNGSTFRNDLFNLNEWEEIKPKIKVFFEQESTA